MSVDFATGLESFATLATLDRASCFRRGWAPLPFSCLFPASVFCHTFRISKRLLTGIAASAFFLMLPHTFRTVKFPAASLTGDVRPDTRPLVSSSIFRECKPFVTFRTSRLAFAVFDLSHNLVIPVREVTVVVAAVVSCHTCEVK